MDVATTGKLRGEVLVKSFSDFLKELVTD